MAEEPVTRADLEALEASVARAIAIVLGCIAETGDCVEIACHLATAFESANATSADPIRDRILRESLHLVFEKALQSAHTEKKLREVHRLYARFFGSAPTN